MNTAKEKIYSKDIILILISSFFYFSSPMLTTPLITGFSGSLGANASLMGLIGGLMNLCALFCRPFVGNLADKISKYKLSLLGGLMMTAASVGYVFAQNPEIIVISRVINGIGFACCSVCMSTWLSNLLPEDKIGSGMGVYGAMNALAMGVSPAIGIFIYQKINYRAAFILASVFSAMIIIIIQFITNRGEPAKTTLPQNIQPKSKPNFQFCNIKVLPIALIVMLFAVPYCATQSFLVTYINTKSINASAGLFFPTYAAVLFVLRFTLKELFDKLSFKTFLIFSCFCAAASILCLSFMNGNFLLLTSAVFMSGGYGIMCSVSQSAAILLAGPENRGLANSTYYIGLDLGMTLGPFLGGILMEHLPVQLFYPVLLLTIPLLLLVYRYSNLSKKN